jgi:DNA-binding transcriptional MerR regulator
MSKPTPSSKAAPAAASNGLSVTELARRTGVSVRNIRAYQTAGLLPPPVLQGRTAWYSPRHLSRLELIRELRQVGFKLETIGEMLERVPKGVDAQYALMAQMFSNGFFQVERPQQKSLQELTAHWGADATQAQLNELIESGLYRAIEPKPESTTPRQAQFEMLSPSLWNIGKQLADMNVPLETVLEMQSGLIRHTRAIAQAYVDQFIMAMVREATASAIDATTLTDEHGHLALPPNLLRTVHAVIERLRPLAIGSVSAAFPVVLQQEFDRDVLDRIQRCLNRPTATKASPRQPT